MEKTHEAVTGHGSALKKYRNVMVGRDSFIALLYYEFCAVLGPIPGALGVVLRKIFWPRLFGSCGKGCMFGPGIILRHPGRIHLGNTVIIGENCIFDGRNVTSDTAIVLGNDVMFSNNVLLSCKAGHINIGDRAGVNSYTIIQSTNDCQVEIGADCIIGQNCTIIGGGSYNIDRLDLPIHEQGIRPDGGVKLAANVWLGANVTVLGGARMEEGSVAGACSLVTGPIEANSVCMGIPAKVVRKRV
jgi:acetyltransferase-like isoleucine patch superfamily enzyme